MCIIDNSVVDYSKYQAKQVKKLVESIPVEHRESLLERIKMQASIFPVANPLALERAIKELQEEKSE